MQRTLLMALACGALCTLAACGGSGGGARHSGDEPEVTQYRYFSGSHLGGDQEDWELWRTDGTAEGTARVHDVSAEAASYPENITQIGGRTFFTAWDADSENLWVTDGSDDGLTLLVQAGSEGYLNQLTAVENLLYFVMTTQEHGSELWRSDGTPAGTRMVIDLTPGSCNSHPASLTAFDGALYFSAVNSCIGRPGLWKTDGTAEGAVAVLAPQNGSYPANLTPWGDSLYFSAIVETEYGLWKSDGTADGTTRVRGIRLAQQANLGWFTVAGDLLFFRANDGEHGTEIWKSDGTEAGTQNVLDLLPGADSSNPQWLIAHAGQLYFAAYSGGTSSGLWRTDGTAAGTVEIRDTDGNSVRAMNVPVIYRDSLYFGALWDGRHVMWRLQDGGDVAEILNASVYLDNGNPPFVLNDRLMFLAEDSAHGVELWRSEGTFESTVLVQDICPGACSGWEPYYVP